MRRYGSTRRNPNPQWPGIQNTVVIPPGSNAAALGRTDQGAENDNVIKITDKEMEYVHERDGLVPIMNYMPENKIFTPSAANNTDKKLSDMSVNDYLYDKTGNYAKIEFIFGENTHIEKTGVIDSVGKDFVVLTEAGTGSRIVCWAKNIKFINIYDVK